MIEIDEQTRELLIARASELARRGQAPDRRAAGPPVTVVAVGGEQLGLPVNYLRRVIRAPHITPLPGVPPWSRGSVQVRSKLLTVVDIAALIFLPGLFTAEVVSNVAGRGMGLDAVRNNIEQLGGGVSVAATPELGGTTFEIRIPATVLGVKGLLVQSGAVIHTLPLSDVTLVAAVARTDLEQNEGREVFRDTDGRPVRVRWLEALLGHPLPPPQPHLRLVALRRGAKTLAVVVDRVLGEREFVARPLPWNADTSSGINGALILPDGSVALSLDATALFDAAQQESRSEQLRRAAERSVSDRRLLVVDDSLAARTLAAQTLRAAGYDVSVAADGQQAWEALQRDAFDLVASDVQMPGMDGLELTTLIRSSPLLGQLPVVLVTSRHSPEDVARGAEVGADEYIVKGQFDQEQLLRTARRLLE